MNFIEFSYKYFDDNNKIALKKNYYFLSENDTIR